MKIDNIKKILLTILIANIIYQIVYHTLSFSNKNFIIVNNAILTQKSVFANSYNGTILNVSPYNLTNVIVFIKLYDTSNRYITSFSTNSSPSLLMPFHKGTFSKSLDKEIPLEHKLFYIITSDINNGKNFESFFNFTPISILIIINNILMIGLAILGIFYANRWIYAIILVWEISLSLIYVSSSSYVVSFFFDKNFIQIKNIIWLNLLSYIYYTIISMIAAFFTFKIYNTIDSKNKNYHYLFLSSFSIGLSLILYFNYRIGYVWNPIIIGTLILITLTGWFISRSFHLKISNYQFSLHRSKFGIPYLLKLLHINNNIKCFTKRDYYFYMGNRFNKNLEIFNRSFIPWILVLLLLNSFTPFLQNYTYNINYSVPLLNDHFVIVIAIIIVILIAIFFILPLSTIDLSNLYLKQKEKGTITSVYQEFNKILSISGYSIIFHLVFSSAIIFHIITGMMDINDLWISVYNFIISAMLAWIPFYFVFILYIKEAEKYIDNFKKSNKNIKQGKINFEDNDFS